MKPQCRWAPDASPYGDDGADAGWNHSGSLTPGTVREPAPVPHRVTARAKALMQAMVLIASLPLVACGGDKGVKPDQAQGAPGDLYVQIAAEYYRLGEIEPALKNAQKALAEGPDNAHAHNVIATIYQQLRQYDQAERHFRIALSLTPNDPYLLMAWGNFLCDRGDYAGAAAQYQQALSNPLFNAPWVAETRAGICARRASQTATAEQALRRALSTNPGYPPALLEMAELDYAEGRYRSAKSYLERYFAAGGRGAKPLLLGVRTERALGSRPGAARYEKLLRENYPDAPEIQSLREPR
ncbi:MAG: type IV pilus biogenesis/stability protein PilW [Gammaproteobacteria bacterium]|nr:MAG: type IV pilus biogenesis/stability protein PilW [Gammaproteobacteria bacterium]